MFWMQIDNAAMESDMRRLSRIYHVTLFDMLKRVSKNILFDCVKRTPPMEFGKSLKQSFREQLSIGKTATNRDISRTFVSYKKLDVFQRTSSSKGPLDETKGSRQIKKFIEQGRIEDANALMRVLRWRSKGIIQSANPYLHTKVRDRRGRVSPRNQPWIVADSSSIDDVRRVRTNMVGTGKSGWFTAALKLGVKLPNWINNGKGAGTCEIVQGENPSIAVSNMVPYIQQAGIERRIVERAFADRVGKLAKEVQFAQAAVLRKLGLPVTIK